MKTQSKFTIFFLFLSLVLMASACSPYKKNLFEPKDRVFKHYKHNYSVAIPDGYVKIDKDLDNPFLEKLLVGMPAGTKVFYNSKEKKAIGFLASRSDYGDKIKDKNGEIDLTKYKERFDKEKMKKEFEDQADKVGIELLESKVEIYKDLVHFEFRFEDLFSRVDMDLRLIFYQENEDKPGYSSLLFFGIAPENELVDIDQIFSGVTLGAFSEEERKK